MEGTATQSLPAWVTPEDRELHDHWQAYSYEDPNRGKPTRLADKFSACLGYSHGGVSFRYRNQGPNHAPCILRLRNGGLFFRLNLRLPDDHDDAWLGVGLAIR